jgi:hypothetical protein
MPQTDAMRLRRTGGETFGIIKAAFGDRLYVVFPAHLSRFAVVFLRNKT